MISATQQFTNILSGTSPKEPCDLYLNTGAVFRAVTFEDFSTFKSENAAIGVFKTDALTVHVSIAAIVAIAFYPPAKSV